MNQVLITPYRDGPILVRGPIRLTDADGQPIEGRRKTIALCRCGKSGIRPLCDGTHNRIDFRAPGYDGRCAALSEPEAPQPAWPRG